MVKRRTPKSKYEERTNVTNFKNVHSIYKFNCYNNVLMAFQIENGCGILLTN